MIIFPFHFFFSALLMPDLCLILMKNGGYSGDMIPTVRFNMIKVTKGNGTIKL
ncbi:hypothetical protein GLYMA_01G060450v4 [Glycine max]|nr:hypothetical protein GLYMA_01G060450v4 [Glycine max]KAH1161835.1 hypothetical protein GYH30_000631 [Glycine max]